MDFDISNISIPIAAILGCVWLLTTGHLSGWLVLLAGFAWWGIDQIIKWKKMEYIQNNS